jgi:hypothetical protein
MHAHQASATLHSTGNEDWVADRWLTIAVCRLKPSGCWWRGWPSLVPRGIRYLTHQNESSWLTFVACWKAFGTWEP